ncbi:hypothetical protein MRB53_006076 [Persea americana]|uniref:Uncharacterized protein n=1 Tax=Persea americana TaxID=3435 RepID=A0ACC2MFM7_PERAE|nr:hypothetical protein MRB53_006076 [Persea americana]
MMSMKNWVEVSRSATDEDLKRAYKRIAMERQIYDQCGEKALKSGVSQPQANGFRFNSRNLDDIFNEFFGSGGRSSPFPPGESFYRADGPPRKAAPVENKLLCSLEELYSGSKRKMRISRNVLNPSGFAIFFFAFCLCSPFSPPYLDKHLSCGSYMLQSK